MRVRGWVCLRWGPCSLSQIVGQGRACVQYSRGRRHRTVRINRYNLLSYYHDVENVLLHFTFYRFHQYTYPQKSTLPADWWHKFWSHKLPNTFQRDCYPLPKYLGTPLCGWSFPLLYPIMIQPSLPSRRPVKWTFRPHYEGSLAPQAYI